MKEFLAATHLSQQGFLTYIPLLQTFVLVNGIPKEKVSPLFPSYVFVFFDVFLHKWASISGTTGVTRLLQNLEVPQAVPDGFVEFLIERGLFSPSEEARIKPGQRLKITEGPFLGQEGFCTWSSSRRVGLLMQIMNKEVPLNILVSSVEKIK